MGKQAFSWPLWRLWKQLIFSSAGQIKTKLSRKLGAWGNITSSVQGDEKRKNGKSKSRKKKNRSRKERSPGSKEEANETSKDERKWNMKKLGAMLNNALGWGIWYYSALDNDSSWGMGWKLNKLKKKGPREIEATIISVQARVKATIIVGARPMKASCL